MSIKDLLVTKPAYDHKINYAKIQRASLQNQRKMAQFRDFFRDQDNHVITEILKKDLTKYVDNGDISRMKHITVDFFVSAFLKKLCNVYDTPPLFKFTDPDSQDAVRMNELMSEVRLNQVMAENLEKMRLHNTILTHVKYNEDLDKIYLDNNYNVGNTYVQEHETDGLEWQALAYEYITEHQKIIWVAWDRERGEHYYLETKKELPHFDQEARFMDRKWPIPGNDGFAAPNYGGNYTMPWTVFRYENHNNQFWGNGMDSLVELVRSMNMLLTVVNDDTIQETIRLLILNFNPTGSVGDHGQLKTGLRHPLFVESGIGQQDSPSGQIVSADLYNAEVFDLVQNLGDVVARLHNVDSPIKTELEQNLSGIALKLKTEPLIRQWGHDINIMRYADMDMLRKLVMVNNYHRPNNQISESLLDDLAIDYMEPKVVSDEQADYELERMKWEDGTSSPVLFVRKMNPEFDDDQAKEYIQNNLADLNELTGLGSIPVFPGTDENNLNL